MRRGALLALCALIVAAVAIAAFEARRPTPLPSRASGDRPTLLLLTSLPLMFGEEFDVSQNGSPALTALNSRYRVVPISVADPAGLAKGRLLLMAQPFAQPPEDLVALDAWVRRGGRLLLLADPMLEWPSTRPLGDPLRPSTAFMDTGLLAHWGMKLEPPTQRGEAQTELGGVVVITDSPGKLAGGCALSGDRLVAHCRIGNGAVTVVADADFLDTPAIGEGAGRNLDGLLEELASLERGDSVTTDLSTGAGD